MRRIKVNTGFTIFELLIALFLSGVVMAGLLQSYQSLMTYLENSREIMNTNRKVCLLFNQLERDFTTSFIPVLHKEIISDKDKGKKKQDKQDDKKEDEPFDTPKTATQDESGKDEKKKKQKEKEEKKDFFFGASEDGDVIKIEGKRVEPFKHVTFITTNALQVYGQRRVRFVRVKYELVKDKAKSTRDKESYTLVRRETEDIKNVKVKISDSDEKQAKENPVRVYELADMIKSMYVVYVTEEEKEEDEKETKRTKKPEEPKELRSFAWGEKDYSKGVVPEHVEIKIIFWNSDMTGERSFDAIFPIFSYPTERDKTLRDARQKARPQGERGAKNQDVGQQASAAQLTGQIGQAGRR